MRDWLSRRAVVERRAATFGVWARAVPAALLFATGLAPQTAPPASTLAMADDAIQGLHETSVALAAAIRRFHSHLDEAMTRFDRGYLGVDGSHVKGADSGVAGARADLMLAATRRFTAFRMLAAREPGYDPPPVQDLEQIQKLIAEARRRSDASSAVLRRLLQVSVNEIDQRRDAAAKDRHERLLKERTAAEDAAKKAFLELPLALPDAASPEESHRKAWELLVANQPLPLKGATAPPADVPEPASLRPAARQLCTLVEDTSLRMAITDAGIRDKAGRHVFYQEEWVQRGPVVARLRWRVAVDTVNGFHILIKSYPPVELRGTLDDVYQPRDRFNLWYQEPDADATEPPRADITAVMGETTHSREAIRAAVADFRSTIHEALLADDRRHAAAVEAALDAELSPDLRETLFAIRGHMAGVPGIVDAENKVRRAIEQAASAVERLQALARWGNHIAEPGSPPDQLQWDWVLDRADREIDLVRTARADASRLCPRTMRRRRPLSPRSGRIWWCASGGCPGRVPAGDMAPGRRAAGGRLRAAHRDAAGDRHKDGQPEPPGRTHEDVRSRGRGIGRGRLRGIRGAGNQHRRPRRATDAQCPAPPRNPPPQRRNIRGLPGRYTRLQSRPLVARENATNACTKPAPCNKKEAGGEPASSRSNKKHRRAFTWRRA